MFPSGVKTVALLLGLLMTSGMLRVAAAHDGDPLNAFGSQGRAQFNFTTSPVLPVNYAAYNESLYSPVALQADGKVVLAATAKNLSNNDFGILRLNADGSRDTSFGPTQNGQTIVPFDRVGGNEDEPNGIALDEHGNILVSGSAEGNPSDGGFDCAIVRLTPDGLLDSTFSTDGKATIGFDLGPAGQRHDYCMRVAVQRDGKILVVGFAQNRVTPEPGSPQPHKVAIARLTSSGARDTSFNGNGIVILDFGAAYPFCFGTGIVQQNDGGIVIVGSAVDANYDHSFAMARLHADGTLDSAFGSNGMRVFRPTINGYDFGGLEDVVSLSDGSFVVNGYVAPAGSSNYDYYFARVRSDGSLDPAFGSNGSAVVPIDLGGAYEDISFAMALDSHGRIVANGVSTLDSSIAMALVRLTPDGQLDASFGNGGVQVTSSTPPNDIMFGEVGGGVAIGAGDTIVAASLVKVDGSGDLEVGVVELVGDTIFSSGFAL